MTGDIIVAVQDFEAAATGNLDVTSTDITGITPKAVIVVVGNHNIANDPVATVNASQSIGFYDGTTQVYATCFSEDNVASTDTYRNQNTGSVIRTLTETGSTRLQATASFISGGVRLNFTTVPAFTIRGYCIMFCGTDLSASVGSLALGTGTSALNVTTPGATSDIVFFTNAGTNNTTTVSADAHLGFGIAVNDGSATQKCFARAEVDNAANAGPAVIIYDNRCMAKHNASSAAVVYDLTYATHASGFSVTPSASSGSNNLHWLELRLAKNHKFKLIDIDTPTVTGTVGYTGLGAKPQAAITVATSQVARNTAELDSINTESWGIGAMTLSEYWASVCTIVTNSDPTDTLNFTFNLALRAAWTAATLSSLDSDGLTLNYISPTGNRSPLVSQMAFMLMIEERMAIVPKTYGYISI